jgi:hypothetical protein
MSAVQDGLHLSPEAAKMRLSSLEAQRHTLPQIAENKIPNAQKANENRAEIFAVRKELLEVLVAK